MINITISTALKNRILSFVWRLGAVVAVAVLAEALNFIKEVRAPEFIVVLVALVVGEITKYLNNPYHPNKSVPEVSIA